MSASRLRSLLLDALRDPPGVAQLVPAEWTRLVRDARKNDLLGRLASRIEEDGAWTRVPTAPAAHLASAQLLAGAQHTEVRREVQRLQRLFQPLGIPVVLLKGAAYVYAGLPAAQGRMFSDIDILVPRESLPTVEANLMLEGWATTHHSAYDQHYYRKWMHELPPLRHIRRGTVLDVHHAILPETARMQPDSAKLWEAVVPVPDCPGLYVLGELDMVLHSMTHLLSNEEFTHGLRDLSDIDLLLRHFGRDPAFWERLSARASELGLGRFLYYGLTQAQALPETPLPPEALARAAASRPPAPVAALMDVMWRYALSAGAANRGSLADSLLRFLLYLRAHWLRMPVWLLAGHIAVKAFVKEGGER